MIDRDQNHIVDLDKMASPMPATLQTYFADVAKAADVARTNIASLIYSPPDWAVLTAAHQLGHMLELVTHLAHIAEYARAIAAALEPEKAEASHE